MPLPTLRPSFLFLVISLSVHAVEHSQVKCRDQDFPSTTLTLGTPSFPSLPPVLSHTLTLTLIFTLTLTPTLIFTLTLTLTFTLTVIPISTLVSTSFFLSQLTPAHFKIVVVVVVVELLVTGTILILDISGFTQLGEHLKTTKVQKVKGVECNERFEFTAHLPCFLFFRRGLVRELLRWQKKSMW